MPIQYQLLASSDAALLASAIERVYGSTYPIPEFYDHEYIEREISSGRLHTIVARDGEQLAGCMSTVLEEVGDVTADGSALMVAQQYRGQGITAAIGAKMVETYQRLGLCGLHLYALALHDLVQNQSGAAGAIVTGALPAWFSRRARVSGYDYPDARIGAVCLYMPLGKLPAREVYLPDIYEDILTGIYSQLTEDREFLRCPNVLTLPAQSIFSLDEKPLNQQTRLVLEQTGEDLRAILADLLEKVAADSEQVIYLDIPLSDPGCAYAVNAARDLGLFFGALMADRRGCDRLRMQYFAQAAAAPGHMVVATPEARQLLDFILSERDGG